MLYIMSEDIKLWQCIYNSFEYHRKESDHNAQAAMDRVAMKCIGLCDRRSFNPGNCTVREEILSADALQNLKLYHNRTNPYHLAGPIIVLLYGGQKVVIEGNTRVNEWISRKFKEPFSAIFVEPIGNSG
jgi:hypothetical protein